MKGLPRSLEDNVRNAHEMREFMQHMGLDDHIVERAVKKKYNLPGPEPELPVNRGRRGQKPGNRAQRSNVAL